MAIIYLDEGQYAQAQPLFEQTLSIKERSLGPEHPDTATSLDNLASLYKDVGQDVQAQPLYKRALAIREKVLGPEHPDTATSLDNLAELYKDVEVNMPRHDHSLSEPYYPRKGTWT